MSLLVSVGGGGTDACETVHEHPDGRQETDLPVPPSAREMFARAVPRPAPLRTRDLNPSKRIRSLQGSSSTFFAPSRWAWSQDRWRTDRDGPGDAGNRRGTGPDRPRSSDDDPDRVRHAAEGQRREVAQRLAVDLGGHRPDRTQGELGQVVLPVHPAAAALGRTVPASRRRTSARVCAVPSRVRA